MFKTVCHDIVLARWSMRYASTAMAPARPAREWGARAVVTGPDSEPNTMARDGGDERCADELDERCDERCDEGWGTGYGECDGGGADACDDDNTNNR